MKKAIPNLLTLLRLALSGLLCYSIANRFDSFAIPLAASALVFLSDCLDGWLARRWRCQTRFGMVFDVAADLFYIMSFSLLLYTHKVLPLWYVLAVICKFTEFILTSAYQKWRQGEMVAFVFDGIGRVSAVLFYALPLCAYLSYVVSMPLYRFVNPYCLLACVSLASISSIGRIINCVSLRQENSRA